MDFCISNIDMLQSLIFIQLLNIPEPVHNDKTTPSSSFLTGTYIVLFCFVLIVKTNWWGAHEDTKKPKCSDCLRTLLAPTCNKKMLVWGHWRLGKNRLCVYPFLPFFCSQCWFKSRSENKLSMFKKLNSPFWKPPNSSSHDVWLIVLNEGVIILLTQPLWAQGIGADLERFQFVSKKSAFLWNLILPPASHFNAHFVIHIDCA